MSKIDKPRLEIKVVKYQEGRAVLERRSEIIQQAEE